MLQTLDKSHTIARHAKSKSKIFLRCVAKVQAAAVEYARKHGYDAVCCGHTHAAAAVVGGGVDYFNSGCWTEIPAHYLTVKAGRIELCAADDFARDPAGEPAAEVVPVPAGSLTALPA